MTNETLCVYIHTKAVICSICWWAKTSPFVLCF